MAHEIKFAIYSIKKNVLNSAELRSSFLMNVVGMALGNGSLLLLWVFFVRSAGIVGGWTSVDIIGLLGFSTLAYGLTASFFYGILKLPEYVSSGSFDHFILSPKNLLLRIATSAFLPSATGDMLSGVICLAVYSFAIRIEPLQILFLIVLSITAAFSFLASAIIIFSISFLVVDPGAATNSAFNLYINPSLFHGGAFQGVMRFIFTFIIPSLLIGTLPVEALKNTSWPNLALIVAVTAFFCFLSIFIFNKALKKYESSNFMTFGN